MILSVLGVAKDPPLYEVQCISCCHLKAVILPPFPLSPTKISSADFNGRKEFDRRGFGVLAKYIGVFGNPNNEGKTAIAMTAPVVTQEAPKKGPSISLITLCFSTAA